jgi:hypothetical protein
MESESDDPVHDAGDGEASELGLGLPEGRLSIQFTGLTNLQDFFHEQAELAAKLNSFSTQIGSLIQPQFDWMEPFRAALPNFTAQLMPQIPLIDATALGFQPVTPGLMDSIAAITKNLTPPAMPIPPNLWDLLGSQTQDLIQTVAVTVVQPPPAAGPPVKPTPGLVTRVVEVLPGLLLAFYVGAALGWADVALFGADAATAMRDLLALIGVCIGVIQLWRMDQKG